eukprot:TRINITY_DN6498_c0_g1_i1.p1 TRINITY_DN6498_c0_g1~~TRINITY_DN6498_c0_g1_i1.p1  ORF type:complete len:266 (+),score=62.25 TRINITY_DN6498_c0_g1_i1:142-939(+)
MCIRDSAQTATTIMRLGALLLTAVAGAMDLATLGAPDSSSPEPLNRLAFGSCHAHGLDDVLFEDISAFKPEAFVWLGDAVYPREGPGFPSRLRSELQALKRKPRYAQILESAQFVDGTFDDHDTGLNDGGSTNQHLIPSQQIMLDFFGVPNESPRRTRRGLYWSHLFGPPGKQVKLIVLDTRTHRDPMFLPEFGGSLPGGAARAISILQNASQNHAGDVLGETQWELSLIHISEPTRLLSISYAVFCLKKKKKRKEKRASRVEKK